MASQRRAFDFTLLFSVPFVAAFLTVPDVIMRAMFARGAFSKADAAAAGATLAAYAVGLIPFVLIRSAVATFYARKDTATPVKAALTGVAVNVALKIALVGALAQVGLALATAVGAWINLLLVIGFAVRAGYLEFDRALMQSLAKFVVCGVVLAAALWAAARFATAYFMQLSALRDEAALVSLIAVGAVVYAGSVLLLFGKGWLRSLVRS
jgi:putative peptidoglycan lipid II flippase